MGRFDLDKPSFWAVVVAVVIAAAVIGMAIMPIYNVWSKELSGKADLKEAEWSRQIAVQEAQARLDSAALDAQSEIARAYGVAEANKIIGDSLRNNTGYLHYLWIQGLHDNNSETIYVPTEANMPILEAGRAVFNDSYSD